jgi:Glyoxalase-like domain
VFAGFRFPPEVISLAVRWYLRYSLSYRDVEELLAERGVTVDHVTMYRWVQRFTAEYHWPDPAVPQQIHLDIMVEDHATAGPRVPALGATQGDREHVYADPVGYPFCLIKRPRWAPSIPEG